MNMEMLPNQSGSFNVEGRMEWYFGTDFHTLTERDVSLTLDVLDSTVLMPTTIPTDIPQGPPCQQRRERPKTTAAYAGL